MNKELRGYQQNALENAEVLNGYNEEVNGDFKTLISLPTGSRKDFCSNAGSI